MLEISNDTWLEISRDLEQHHALFYQCWGLGHPRFTESIPTAGVGFNHEGEFIDFMFNPKFWDSLDHYNRLVVIAHECLHVLLKHGLRTVDKKESNRCNIALDIVVNHMLCQSFGFDRSRIKDQKDLCWTDTVFSKEIADIVPDNESFEFYYRLIPPNPAVKILDDHSLIPSDLPKVIDKLDGSLTNEEKQSVQGLLSKHCQSTLDQWTIVNVKRVIKRKWETIIKNWCLRYLKEDLRNIEQWARLSRRLTLLPEEILLPTEMEYDALEKDRLPVYLFLDTSGSCANFKERFWKAGASLPPDRFAVRMFCFDVAVEETSIESKQIRYGGGTSFAIIEKHIQEIIKKENIRYPEAVFIITDGYGDHVSPQVPNHWHWFLTEHHSIQHIPKKSKIYRLGDYE